MCEGINVVMTSYANTIAKKQFHSIFDYLRVYLLKVIRVG